MNQHRYTWRHNNVINYIVENIDTKRFSVYSDIEGYQTSNGGSMPLSLTVISLKPDIVILDTVNKKANILELTVHFEHNIEKQHKYKMNKYSHFSDITSYSVSIMAFEIGSRGLITPSNLKHIKFIHTLTTKKYKTK